MQFLDRASRSATASCYESACGGAARSRTATLNSTQVGSRDREGSPRRDLPRAPRRRRAARASRPRSLQPLLAAARLVPATATAGDGGRARVRVRPPLRGRWMPRCKGLGNMASPRRSRRGLLLHLRVVRARRLVVDTGHVVHEHGEPCSGRSCDGALALRGRALITSSPGFKAP